MLKVVATDPGSVRDFQAFARQTGNELVEQSSGARTSSCTTCAGAERSGARGAQSSRFFR